MSGERTKHEKVLRYARLRIDPDKERKYHPTLLNMEIFSSFFLPGWKRVYDPSDPDIVFVPVIYSSRRWEEFRAAYLARRQFGFHSVLCYWNDEPEPAGSLYMDYTFSFFPTSERNHQILFFTSLFDMGLNPLENVNREWHLPVEAQAKTKFCHYIYGLDTEEARRHKRKTDVRRDFCKSLMKYKRVDCYGKDLNNAPKLAPTPDPEPDRLDWTKYYVQEDSESRGVPGVPEKLKVMRDHKFGIAFENVSRDHYVTEKIFHCLAAGNVPIYWGCPRIAEYVNPERFINCHDFGSFEEVIEKVKEIDNDPKLYEKYINAPVILPDSLVYEITEGVYQRVHEMAEKATATRKPKRRKWMESLRLLLMWLWNSRHSEIFYRGLTLKTKATVFRAARKVKRLVSP